MSQNYTIQRAIILRDRLVEILIREYKLKKRLEPDIISLFKGTNRHQFRNFRNLAIFLIDSGEEPYRDYSLSIVTSALPIALRGIMPIEEYAGRVSANRVARGIFLYAKLKGRDERKGAAGMTAQERSRYGKKGADKIVAESLGCHGVKGEARAEMFRKVIRGRGLTPFSGDFRETIYGNVDEGGYMLAARVQAGDKRNVFLNYGGWPRIIREVNGIWENNRNVQACLNYCSYVHKRARVESKAVSQASSVSPSC